MENNHIKQLTMLENVIGEDNNANLRENIVIENTNNNSDDLMNIASFFNISIKISCMFILY